MLQFTGIKYLRVWSASIFFVDEDVGVERSTVCIDIRPIRYNHQSIG